MGHPNIHPTNGCCFSVDPDFVTDNIEEELGIPVVVNSRNQDSDSDFRLRRGVDEADPPAGRNAAASNTAGLIAWSTR